MLTLTLPSIGFGVLLLARIWSCLRNIVISQGRQGNQRASSASTPTTLSSLFNRLFGRNAQRRANAHTTNDAHTTTTAAAVGEEARSNATLPLYTPYPQDTTMQHNDTFFIRLFSARSSPPQHHHPPPPHWPTMPMPANATDVQMQMMYARQVGYAFPGEPPPAYTPPRGRLWRFRLWNRERP
jgi:hypothetical protein